jgi:hypothetical protein
MSFEHSVIEVHGHCDQMFFIDYRARPALTDPYAGIQCARKLQPASYLNATYLYGRVRLTSPLRSVYAMTLPRTFMTAPEPSGRSSCVIRREKASRPGMAPSE